MSISTPPTKATTQVPSATGISPPAGTSSTPGSSPLTPSASRRLPTTSPPSERLRRLAPGPLKVPPTPPLPSRAGYIAIAHPLPAVCPAPRVGSSDKLVGLARGTEELRGEDDEAQRAREKERASVRQSILSLPTRRNPSISGPPLIRHVRTPTYEEILLSDGGHDDPFALEFHLAVSDHPSPLSPSAAIITSPPSIPGGRLDPRASLAIPDFQGYRTSSGPIDIPSLGRPRRPAPNRQDSDTSYMTTTGTDSTYSSFSTSSVVCLPLYVDGRPSNASFLATSAPPAPPPSAVTFTFSQEPEAGAGPSFSQPHEIFDRNYDMRSTSTTSNQSTIHAPTVSPRGASGAKLDRAGTPVSARPDVPDEVIDDWSPLDPTQTFFSEAQPSVRTADELLSPRAYLAAHVPRPVLIQFRDVFGANDTTAPHLPGGIRSPPMSALPRYNTLRDRHEEGSPTAPREHSVPMPLSAPPMMPSSSSQSTLRIKRGREKQTASTQMEKQSDEPPQIVSTSESHRTLYRDPSMAESFATFGKSRTKVMVEHRINEVADSETTSLRPSKTTASRGHKRVTGQADSSRDGGVRDDVSDCESFTFSAYLGDDDPLRLVRDNPAGLEEEEGRSGDHPFTMGRDELDSPASAAEDELVTPEQRELHLHWSDAGSETPREGYTTGDGDMHGTPTPHSRCEPTVGLGLHLGEKPWSPAIDASRPFVKPGGPYQPGPQTRQRQSGNTPVEGKSARPATALPPLAGSAPSPAPPKMGATRPSTAPKKLRSFGNLRWGKSSPTEIPDLPTSVGMSTSSSATSLVRPRNDEAAQPLPLAPPKSTSLTGKPPSARPSTAHPLSSVPSGTASRGASLESPPKTGTSIAFSVNSYGLTAKGAAATTDLWTGNLKEDLSLGALLVPKDTTVNLWVDQDGTRDVISTLHPIRWHPPDHSRLKAVKKLDGFLDRNGELPSPGSVEDKLGDEKDEGDVFWRTGCLEFGMHPRRRDKWKFSYSAIEPCPALRRVTMNGKQDLDFASRIASLKHRVSGIYSVSAIEKGGARWRFRYMVGLGSKIEDKAERMIIPLSFYANPDFLHAAHASKVGLGNVLTKSMKPKLQAEKIPTPELAAAPKVENASVSASPPHTTASTGKSPGWGLRRRPRTAPDGSAAKSGFGVPRSRQPSPAAIAQTPGGKAPGTALTVEVSTFVVGRATPPPPVPALQPMMVHDRAQTSAASVTSVLDQRRPLCRKDPNSVPIAGPLTPVRPSTANPLTGGGQDEVEKQRVAPFLHNEPVTPGRPSTATGVSFFPFAFGRHRAHTNSSLRSGIRSRTTSSAASSTTSVANSGEAKTPVKTPTSSTFSSSLIKAKKSLASLRPSSRAGTPTGASMPINISKPFDVSRVQHGVSAGEHPHRPAPPTFGASQANVFPPSPSQLVGMRPSTSTGSIPAALASRSKAEYLASRGRVRPSTARDVLSSSALSQPIDRQQGFSSAALVSVPHSPSLHTTPRPASRLLNGTFNSHGYITTPPSGYTYSAQATQFTPPTPLYSRIAPTPIAVEDFETPKAPPRPLGRLVPQGGERGGEPRGESGDHGAVGGLRPPPRIRRPFTADAAVRSRGDHF